MPSIYFRQITYNKNVIDEIERSKKKLSGNFPISLRTLFSMKTNCKKSRGFMPKFFINVETLNFLAILIETFYTETKLWFKTDFCHNHYKHGSGAEGLSLDLALCGGFEMLWPGAGAGEEPGRRGVPEGGCGRVRGGGHGAQGVLYAHLPLLQAGR